MWTWMHTGFLIPWVLYKVTAQHKRRDANAEQSRRMVAKVWSSITLAIQRSHADDEDFIVRFENGMSVTVTISSDHMVLGLGDLAIADPDLEEARGIVMPQLQWLIQEGDQEQPTVGAWLAFLVWWRKCVKRPQASQWVHSHVKDVARRCAVSLQAFGVAAAPEQIDGWDASHSLMDLRGPAGRRAAIDPLTLQMLKAKHDVLGGFFFGGGIADAVCGRSSHAEQTVMEFGNHALFTGVREAFGNVHSFSLNFDLGAYNGLNWNVALIYSNEIDVASVVVPKAGLS